MTGLGITLLDGAMGTELRARDPEQLGRFARSRYLPVGEALDGSLTSLDPLEAVPREGVVEARSVGLVDRGEV